MCQGLYKWSPFETGIIGWGGALNFTGGKTGSEKERDLLKVTQQCLGWNTVALPSFCYTFLFQGVEGDIGTGARDSCG